MQPQFLQQDRKKKIQEHHHKTSHLALYNQYTTKLHCLSIISFQYFPFKCHGKLSNLIFLSEPSKMHFSSSIGNIS